MDHIYMENCQRHEGLCESYFAYTREVFGFDLAAWRDAGYWDESYIPHSLVDGGRVVANVSASLMTLQVNGEDVPAVQLGSVGVLSQYRGRGLAKTLMERVLDRYKGYPLIFLFAGGQVSGFYTRFGFRRVPEIQPCIRTHGGGEVREAHHLAWDAEPVRRLTGARLQRSAILDARDNPSVYLFHMLYEFGESIYHIPEYDIVFLAEYDGDTAHIYDILSKNPVSFGRIASYLRRPETREIIFHFTPDWLDGDYEPIPWKEDGMYVIGDVLEGADPFKFPVTAQT